MPTETQDTTDQQALPDYLIQAGKSLAKERERIGALEEASIGRTQKLTAQEEDLARQRAGARAKALPEVKPAQEEVAAAAKAVPPVPELPTPPDTKRRPFLEGPGKPGESINAFLQALSLLAAPLAGVIHKDGLTATNALNGAMQGWIKGDDERVAHEMEAWKASTQRVIQNATMQHQHYQDILSSAKINLDQKLKSLELAGMEYEDQMMVNAAQQKGETATLNLIMKRGKDLDTLERHYDDLLTRLQIAEMTRASKQVLSGPVRDALMAKGIDPLKATADDIAAARDQVNKEKVSESVAIGVGRGAGYAQYRIGPYIDMQEGTVTGLSATDYLAASKKEPGRYVPYGPGMAVGQAPAEMIGKKADITTLTSALRQAQVRVSATNFYVNTIDKNSDFIGQLEKKYGKNEFARLFNQAQNNIIQGVEGSGDLASLQLVVISTSNELAKLESGSLGIAEVSVQQADMMHKIHDYNLRAEDMKTLLQTGKDLGKIRQKSNDQELQRLRQSLRGVGTNVPPAAGGEAGKTSALTPDARQRIISSPKWKALPDGEPIVINGQQVGVKRGNSIAEQ
jgi:hypothetical protein